MRRPNNIVQRNKYLIGTYPEVILVSFILAIHKESDNILKIFYFVMQWPCAD